VREGERERGASREREREKTHLGVKLVVAEIERCVDRLEGLKVNVNTLLLAVVCEDGSTVQHEAIVRHP